MADDLDALDQGIVAELRRDGRLANSSIARRLGVSETTARKRVRRLIDDGIVRIAAAVNLSRLGYELLVVIGIAADANRILDIAKDLARAPEVRLLLAVSGRYDITATVCLRSESELYAFLTERVGGISGVSSAEALHILRMVRHDYFFTESFDTGQSATSQAANASDWSPYVDLGEKASGTGEKGMVETLDALDRRIISELRMDGRQANTEIARRLGVSEATVRSRVQRLVSAGIIRVSAAVNLSRLGYELYVLIGVRCSPAHIPEVISALSSAPQARSISAVSGRWNLLVTASFQSKESLFFFLTEEIGRTPGVSKVEAIHVLREIKRDYYYWETEPLASRSSGAASGDGIVEEALALE